jgi:hypothetical protein
VRSADAIQRALTNRRLLVDFKYFNTELDIDFSVNVLSAGGSIFKVPPPPFPLTPQCDVVVPLLPSPPAEPLRADEIDAARAYVLCAMSLSTQIPQDVSKVGGGEDHGWYDAAANGGAFHRGAADRGGSDGGGFASLADACSLRCGDLRQGDCDGGGLGACCGA